MFYYKLFTPLCNCFLFPCSHFKHLKIYHLIFSIGITPLTFYYFTGIPQCFLLAAPCRSGSALRSIVQLSTFSLPPHRAGISPPSISLLLSHHAFPTQSLTECAPFLRTYRIPPLRSGSALTQALLCNPCPLPPRSPALLIYFFSKFSFSCGSTGSLKSAFIIEGLSVLEEQVSPA